MPVRKPGKVLLRSLPLRFVRERAFGGGRRTVDTSIALVPLIDFLITLTVFLLASFSASGEIRADANLPEATHVANLELAPVIVVNPRVITLEGRRVADTATVLQTPGTEPIDGLAEGLATLRNNWAVLHRDRPFPGTVILNIDRHVDFRAVRKVLASAARAGYPNLSFAVARARSEE